MATSGCPHPASRGNSTSLQPRRHRGAQVGQQPERIVEVGLSDGDVEPAEGLHASATREICAPLRAVPVVVPFVFDPDEQIGVREIDPCDESAIAISHDML